MRGERRAAVASARRRGVVALAAVVALVLLTPVPPASAAGPIDAKGVALSPTATCAFGDVDITYDATAVDQQQVSFTVAGGPVLQERTTPAYKPAYQGTEHVLAGATTAPAAGSVLAVHVVVGAAPASAARAAEFTVAYRCDTKDNRSGGKNEVVWTCFGDAGACPATADAAVAAAAVPGAVPGAALAPAAAYPAASVAAPVRAAPTFSG